MPVTSSIPVNRFRWDAFERSFWTAVEFGVGLGIADLADLHVWWAAPIGVGLAALKAFAAKQLGQKNTASSLSASADPAGATRPVAPPAFQ